MWPETRADETKNFPCAYRGINGTSNSVIIRSCSDRGIWQDPVLNNCLTFVTSDLKNLTEVS